MMFLWYVLVRQICLPPDEAGRKLPFTALCVCIYWCNGRFPIFYAGRCRPTRLELWCHARIQVRSVTPRAHRRPTTTEALTAPRKSGFLLPYWAKVMGRGIGALLAVANSFYCALRGLHTLSYIGNLLHVASLIPNYSFNSCHKAIAYTTIELFLLYSCGNIITGRGKVCCSWVWCNPLRLLWAQALPRACGLSPDPRHL